MKSRYFYIFFIALMLANLNSSAQQFDDDARVWLYIKLDKNIVPKLNFQFTMQNRFENNVSEYSQLNSNFELTYKLNKHFRILTGYTYGENRKINGTYGDRQQLYVGFILRKKTKNFLFSYRNIFQAQVKNYRTSEGGSTPIYFDRNKLSIKYEINKRFDAFVEQEINLSYGQLEYDNISRSRTSVGSVYNISKNSSIEAYFMFQKHFRYTKQPRRDFIYGVTYSYSF